MKFDIEKRFAATDDALPEILGWFEEQSTALLGFEKALNLQLAVEEAVVNIVSYSYKDSEIEPYIIIRMADIEDIIITEIEDGGKPFNQLKNVRYDAVPDVQLRQIGGLGRPFILNFTDEQTYRYEHGCNILNLKVNKHAGHKD